ncbi:MULTISPECIES: response regulator transcription factor [unclassified Enterobacter]|uniref:response regulator transcription factor n=1 Tax=unclassified Enterobacter TaxID=2608935 RepID=UPI0023654FE8|nr:MULTISPECIES: response regulator transcription factor [unclassified Enterobacter]
MNVPFIARFVNRDKKGKSGIAVVSACEIMSAGFYTIIQKMNKFNKIYLFKTEGVIDEILVQNERIGVVIINDDSFTSRKMGSLSIARISQYKDVSVMVVASGSNPVDATEFLQAGAKSFMWKGTPLKHFEMALNNLLRGEPWIEENVKEFYRKATTLESNSLKTTAEKVFMILSNSEQLVIKDYMNGKTVSEIALKKNRSVKTISTQKQTAMRKLGVNNQMELLSRYGHLRHN